MNLNKLLLTTTAIAGFMAAGQIAANADQVTVQDGDTVSKIAQEYNTTVEAIKVANNMANVNLIYTGEVLEVTPGQQTATTDTNTTDATDTQATTGTVDTQSSTASTDNSQSYQNQTYTYSQPQSSYSSNNSYSGSTTSNSSTSASTSSTTSSSSAEEEAKTWIANKESGGSYTATNGQYIGKYQLSASYLNGDYSAANQEATANNYVMSRYGSWTAAKAFWQANGWY